MVCFFGVSISSRGSGCFAMQQQTQSSQPQQQQTTNPDVIRLISGNANRQLAEGIAKHLNVSLEPCDVGRFADNEISIHIKNNIRGSDIFLIQPVCPPNPNDALMELLLLVHTLKLSSARRITVVVPYYGYGRQDRKVKPRTPISAAAVAQLIEAMGPHRVLTVDLHCGQIQGFFHHIPVDNLFADNLFMEVVRTKQTAMEQLAIVSPDAGGVARARRVADKLAAHSVVTILKRRVAANQVDSMQIVGDVRDKVAFIFDDMIDTGSTLIKAAELLRENGASQVFACATHGLFSGEACERIERSNAIAGVYVTDSIPQDQHRKRCAKLGVVSLVQMLAEAIHRLHNDQSLSTLFGGS